MAQDTSEAHSSKRAAVTSSSRKKRLLRAGRVMLWDRCLSRIRRVLTSRGLVPSKLANAMRQAYVFAVAILACTGMFGQDSVPTIKVEAKSAFVWGQDAPLGAV